MPKQFLVLDSESGQIVAVNVQPSAPYTEKTRNIKVFVGGVDVYHEKNAGDKLNTAIDIFDARSGRTVLFADVANAVMQLQGKFDDKGTGYVAVGGSPKLVKWLLEKRGFNVVTVNVSGVADGLTRTQEFEAYLERKLSKLGTPNTYVVMDFVDTGVSLFTLKRDVQDLRKNATVVTVAVGTGPNFMNTVNERFRKDVDFVLQGIATLAAELQNQNLKIYILGRRKEKNQYATWSNAQSKVLETTKYEGMALLPHEHFAKQKAIMPTAMALGTMDLPLADFIDMPLDDPGSDEEGNGSEGEMDYIY